MNAPSMFPPSGPAFGRRHRWTYAGVGLLLALGAPLGLVLLRSLLWEVPPAELLLDEVARDPTLYGYLTVSTAIVLAAFGWILGGLFDAQRRTALADPLTGLPNRRHFTLVLDHAVANCRRLEEHMAVLLLDVDELKRINDTDGHKAGDIALRAVATALRESCRRADVPSRISGDEFAVLAVGATLPEAVALAERIRAALTAKPGAPRVSIGVACRSELGDLDAVGMLAAADAALYVAKSTGRDRVVIAPV